jgi:L-ascorbate metabolism protein UlaG (beta-lactamase superfamily)
MTDLSKFESDILPTAAGDLRMTFLGHGSLLFEFQGKMIYVDPFSRVADFSSLPGADLVLITHEHMDHLDPQALKHIRGPQTEVVLTEVCAQQLSGGMVMRNGDRRTAAGIPIRAVAAYNRVHTRGDGQPFHPQGAGNGYLLEFGGQTVYVAGDTEDIPEMAGLGRVDVAFLPMNLPYTMTPEMTAAAARRVKPRILYPYHFGETRTARLIELLKDAPEIEVRLRRLA